jgi:hypothetical protein
MFTPPSVQNGRPPITPRPQTGGGRLIAAEDNPSRPVAGCVPTLSCCRTYLVAGPLADATRCPGGVEYFSPTRKARMRRGTGSVWLAGAIIAG